MFPDGGAAPDGGGRADVGAPSPPADCATLPPTGLGYTRKGSPLTFADVPLITPAGYFWNPFPNTGALGRLSTAQSEYVAVRFTTPADAAAWSAAAPSKAITWDSSQVGGEASMLNVYVTISRCAGDFRLPTAGSVAPANDPTFARGCTSVRSDALGRTQPRSNVYYQIGDATSDESRCFLAPGRTYFLNFIRANVLDGQLGTPTQEAGGNTSNCINPDLPSCGVQMRVE